MDSTTFEKILPRDHDPAALRRHRWRHFNDVLTRYYVAAGGISVILAILLIFIYLLYVVIPLFNPARLARAHDFAVPGGTGATLYMTTDEYSEIGFRLTRDRRAIFFRTVDGGVLSESRIAPTLSGAEVSAFGAGEPQHRVLGLGLSNGHVLLFKLGYQVSYPNDKRVITPSLSYPLGEQPIELDPQHAALTHLSVQHADQHTTIVAATADGRLLLLGIAATRSLLDDSVNLEKKVVELPIPSGKITHLALNAKQRELLAATDDGFINYYDVSKLSQPRLVDHESAVPDGIQVTALEYLAGGISILVGDSRGTISQWFPVRDENNKYALARVRDFVDQKQAISGIAPEYFRKGFAAIDRGGNLALYHTTAHRTLIVEPVSQAPLTHAAIAPRADALLTLDEAERMTVYRVFNKHPEVSLRSLWGKVWYESRQKPEFIWQSSSASSDFEPKFSLTPLAFGTIKAAVYAMIFAIPISICGAIYTGFFMSARMRGLVKPLIEVMGALPSVILGFLAGLWLAPIIEKNLPGIFLILMLLPIAVLACAFVWSVLPRRLRQGIDQGWEAALLIPVVLLVGYLSLALSQPVELLLFGGNLPAWISEHLGLGFDQRNSLVVGIAMGFAVVPLIFSISEDAIFAVPKHLTIGSLALGATPWQTLVRVVLLTASPGIFSAIMIGLGRAIGETMIVLMATGNTPIMDFNIFEGFRALSANVAVEMPESEVNSTHYRILFLASLVLFVVTFIFNTIAEIVRQRLRAKYSSL